MLPTETRLSIPKEITSLQSTILPDENQSQMNLLPLNLNEHNLLKQHRHRNANYRIPPGLIREYIAPYESRYGVNHRMMPYGYYLRSGQYIVNRRGNIHPVLPFSVSLNPTFTPLGSNASALAPHSISMPQPAAKMQLLEETEYEKFIQSYSITNQQHMLTQSSLPTIVPSSLSTSIIPPVKTKRKYTRRVHRSPVEQQLFQCPNTSSEPIISNYFSSLPLPSMTDTLIRPYDYKFPVNMIRTSNPTSTLLSDSRNSLDPPSTLINNQSTALSVQQHLVSDSTTNVIERCQTSGQRLSNKKVSLIQKPINNSSTNSLSYNLPYLLTTPHERYFMLPTNSMSINIPPVTCTSHLPELDRTFPSLSWSNNVGKVRKKQENPRKSKKVQTPAVEVSMAETNVISTPLITETFDLKEQLQKKSKIRNDSTKNLMKRMKQRNNLAVLKYMAQKRRQQQKISKKKLPAVKTQAISPPTIDTSISKTVEMETKLEDIIASSLKITLNAAQKIESISLYYHQRHKPEHAVRTSSNTDNNLDLLIEAVKLIEMYDGSSKLALKSIK